MKPATRASSTQEGLLRTVGSTAVAKILVMGVSGVLGLFTSRLIIQHFGIDAYTQYGLLTSFTALLAFADLGMATNVINATAASKAVRSDQHVRQTITTAMRILIVAGFVIVTAAAAVSLLGLWPLLLGEGLTAGGSAAAFLCLAVFGLALPLTVGPRILVGLNKTNAHIASQAVIAPFIFCSVATSVAVSLPVGNYLAVLSFLAQALVAVICLVLAGRALRPQLGRAIKDIPKVRRVPSLPAFHLAWPMLIQMVTWTVAMQTDRLLLSHLTTGDELADYNLAAQLFGMVLQAIMSGGLALWPLYAKARADAVLRSPMKPAAFFGVAGFMMAVLLSLLSPWIAAYVSDGKLQLDAWLVGGFVAFVTLQAAKYPLGMYMTDQRGLRFQVVPLLIMVPLNLGLSWWLIGIFGAAGPIMASAVALLVCQVLPDLWYVSKDLRRRRAELVSTDVATDRANDNPVR